VDDKVVGSRKSRKRERIETEKERQEKPTESKKEKRKKKEKAERRRRRSSIYHPAKWARWTGFETSSLEAPAPLGHSLQFLTIRLDQPPYKGTYYVATLRRDSHGRSDVR